MLSKAHTPHLSGSPPSVVQHGPDSAAELDLSPGTSPEVHLTPSSPVQELALLRAENAELRARMDETEQLLQAAALSEENWLERQKESEALLEEKSEVIRVLHHKLQEAQAAVPGEETDAVVSTGQFDKELKHMEERRRQLEADEESLMAQMREMELAMSRDRAELARQRNELQRTHAELAREIEQAARDGGLKERLASLSRRHQEVANPRSAPPIEPKSTSAPSAPPAADNPPKKNSGLFRRLFGGNTE